MALGYTESWAEHKPVSELAYSTSPSSVLQAPAYLLFCNELCLRCRIHTNSFLPKWLFVYSVCHSDVQPKWHYILSQNSLLSRTPSLEMAITLIFLQLEQKDLESEVSLGHVSSRPKLNFIERTCQNKTEQRTKSKAGILASRGEQSNSLTTELQRAAVYLSRRYNEKKIHVCVCAWHYSMRNKRKASLKVPIPEPTTLSETLWGGY